MRIAGFFRTHPSRGSPLQRVYRDWLAAADAADRGALGRLTDTERILLDAHLGTIRHRPGRPPSSAALANGIRRRVMRYTRPFDDESEIQRVVAPFIDHLYRRLDGAVPAAVRHRSTARRRRILRRGE